MYCKKCGNEIKDNEKFCSNCGAERPSIEDDEKEITEKIPLDKNDISQESVEEKTADAEKSVQEHAATGESKTEKKPNTIRNIIFAVLAICIIGYAFSSCGSGGKLSSEKTKIITTLKNKADFRTEYVDEWKETFYRFTYDDKWALQYTENGCSVRIDEPLVQSCFADWFSDTEIGNDSTFAYSLADNCVNMYFDYETPTEGNLSIVMYNIDKDEYTLMIDGDKYAVSDELNDYLKEYGLNKILRQDINDFKTDLSAMDLTLQDLEQINYKDLEKYMKGK